MNREELYSNIKRKKSFLCVGLDTDIRKIPAHLLKEDDPIFAFNKAIIDATADYAIAYKPNLAFYESNGLKGLQSLYKTIDYIRANYPDQFIIADAKRGDIANTAKMYAESFFNEMDKKDNNIERKSNEVFRYKKKIIKLINFLLILK